MNKTYDIKPCPFCGGNGTIIHDTYTNNVECSYVMCENCQARGVKIIVSARYCSDEEAVEKWNRRKGG